MARTGKVKFFNAGKGFGFIVDDEGGRDIFVHISAVKASGLEAGMLTDGQRLTFETEYDRSHKKTKACNLQLEGVAAKAASFKPTVKPEAGTVLTGVVRSLNYKGGFAFIRPDDGVHTDVFVHVTEVRAAGLFDDFGEGDRIRFTVKSGKKGPQATDLSFVTDETQKTPVPKRKKTPAMKSSRMNGTAALPAGM